MVATTIAATTAPALAANLFTNEGAIIFVSCLYGTLFFISISTFVLSIMDNPCSGSSCCSGQEYNFYDDDDESCCGDCCESLKRTCCVLICRWVCLRTYSCCCRCSPNYTTRLEAAVRNLEMRMEDGYETKEEMMEVQLNGEGVDGQIFTIHEDKIETLTLTEDRVDDFDFLSGKTGKQD